MASNSKFLSEITRTRTLLMQQQEALQEIRRVIAESKKLREEHMVRLLKTAAGERTQRKLLKKTTESINEIELSNNELTHNSGTDSYLDKFYKEIIRAQEKERSRIARELHDELGQVIIAIRTEMELAMADGLDL